jgi:hypothetical protein
MSAQANLINNGFRKTATLYWATSGKEFRLVGLKDAWRATRCFVYVWFDEAHQRF